MESSEGKCFDVLEVGFVVAAAAVVDVGPVEADVWLASCGSRKRGDLLPGPAERWDRRMVSIGSKRD